MASDAEIAQTAQEMNLPIDYVQAVYAEDEKTPPPADGEAGSPAPQAEEAGPAADATPAEQTPEPESGEIPDTLADRAKVYGLDPSKFRDADSLQGQIDAYDRQLLEQQQAYQAQQQQLAQQQWAQQQAAQQQQVPAGNGQLPQFTFDLGEDYDPDEVALFNAGLQKVADYFQPLVQQVQQMSQYIQTMHQREQAVQVEQTNKAFDEAVDQLGADIFGQGRYESLSMPEQSQRAKLMDSAYSLVMAYNQRGIPVPAMSELVQQAFRLTFADEAKKTNQAELRQKMVDRSNRRLGTGSSQNTTSRTADGKVKPYQGKHPEKDPVLLAAYKDMLQEQDFR